MSDPTREPLTPSERLTQVPADVGPTEAEVDVFVGDPAGRIRSSSWALRAVACIRTAAL